MSMTLSLRGQLNKSTSTEASAPIQNLFTASGACEADAQWTFTFRKGASPIPDTASITVPIATTIGKAKFLAILVTNDIKVRLTNSDAAVDNKDIEVTIGGPEGALILVNTSITGLVLLSTTTDQTVVKVIAAG